MTAVYAASTAARAPGGRELSFLHLLMPGMLFATVVLLLQGTHVDLRLADAIYRWEGGVWMRHYWVLDTVIHGGGRLLAGVMLLTLLGALAGSFVSPRLRVYRKGLVYLVTVILCAFALINALKAISGIPCPWSVVRYGGSEQIRDVWSGFTFTRGCFPAGHASGGYVWVALYFFALAYFPGLRYTALATGLVLGLVFGLGQQLRGAHFLSHDIWTLAICWYVSLLGYLYFFRYRSSSLA